MMRDEVQQQRGFERLVWVSGEGKRGAVLRE